MAKRIRTKRQITNFVSAGFRPLPIAPSPPTLTYLMLGKGHQPRDERGRRAGRRQVKSDLSKIMGPDPRTQQRPTTIQQPAVEARRDGTRAKRPTGDVQPTQQRPDQTSTPSDVQVTVTAKQKTPDPRVTKARRPTPTRRKQLLGDSPSRRPTDPPKVGTVHRKEPSMNQLRRERKSNSLQKGRDPTGRLDPGGFDLRKTTHPIVGTSTQDTNPGPHSFGRENLQKFSFFSKTPANSDSFGNTFQKPDVTRLSDPRLEHFKKKGVGGSGNATVIQVSGHPRPRGTNRPDTCEHPKGHNDATQRIALGLGRGKKGIRVDVMTPSDEPKLTRPDGGKGVSDRRRPPIPNQELSGD